MKILTSLFLALVIFCSCASTPKSRSAGEVVDDAVITNKLKAKYVKDPLVKAYQIDVDTWKGVVTLNGSVDTQEQIDRAVELAEEQPGIKEVRPLLKIEPETSKKTVGESIKDTFNSIKNPIHHTGGSKVKEVDIKK